ncbi:MAG: hypothetical protein KJ792_08570 [Actinobacteria bacterium]|nr:hypothetical protein [Actinomycetota bacterium]MCG2800642.1 hypothetical protein [Cellulomonas sp.]
MSSAPLLAPAPSAPASHAPHASHPRPGAGVTTVQPPIAGTRTSELAPEEQEAVERPHPGRAAGVALGAIGMLLGLLVGLAALVASAVDLATWTLNAS